MQWHAANALCTAACLVLQVYNDFGPGVHGVFTRDYRLSVMDCRVLITVPACLEILLLSPKNRYYLFF